MTALLNLMNHDPRLADPDDPFNATDVVDTAIPMRRLLLAAGTSESWFIYDEQGGRGNQRQLVMLTLSGDSAECRWACNVGKQVETLGALRKAAKKGLTLVERPGGPQAMERSLGRLARDAERRRSR